MYRPRAVWAGLARGVERRADRLGHFGGRRDPLVNGHRMLELGQWDPATVPSVQDGGSNFWYSPLRTSSPINGSVRSETRPRIR